MGNSDKDKIFGTVIYDSKNPEENQSFVWCMTEENVPSEEVKGLISFLSVNNLIDIDRITRPLTELDLSFIDHSKRNDVIKELFGIRVTMLDGGLETDTFFIHG